MSDEIEIYVDGASKGNNDTSIPSKAYTCVIIPEKSVNIVTSIGDQTNNDAEWQSLIDALTTSNLNGWKKIKIFSDSQLVVNQFNQKWKCKDKRMEAYFLLSKSIVSIHEIDVEVEWIPRERNLAGIELERRT
jgi:ribonuclease HI